VTRWFNTAGPCKPDLHYMLPVMRRLPTVRQLIERQSYFVLHAPRQVGKTTSLMALGRELTREGRYASVLVSMEVGAPFSHDVGAAELAVLSEWRRAAEADLSPDLQPPAWPAEAPGGRIAAGLQSWVKACPRPLVLFLDEIDALQGEALVAVLRQIRAGYPRRPDAFPWSLALVGLRDVRDYKLASGGAPESSHSSSPFNIKVESLTLRSFTREEVAELYAEHTGDTGQAFTPEALDRVFDLTQGQPWLVNALGYQLIDVVVSGAARTITAEDVETAREILIQRQDTHLDSLVERLRDPRVRQVIEPMLAGLPLGDVPDDDRRFVQDLGLVRRDPDGGLVIANPIYHEVIPRALVAGMQDSLPRLTPTWLRPDGRLDPDRLLGAFLAFWREHGQPLLGSAPYHEIAPHLVLMAFLHRVVNGHGTIQREYAVGSGRMDLLVRHGPDVMAMELKVWRDGERDPLGDGIAQLDRYLAGLGLDTGWLVIFDRRRDLPPIAERTTMAPATTTGGRSVTVLRV
jgi:hypothetical protein